LSAFDAAVAIVGILSGAVASVAGFGVGSLLTPLLLTRFDAKLAVALVGIPHAIATAIRLWRLRDHISWPVLRTFGFASAAGGLAGAYAFTRVGGSVLITILGALLVFVGIAELLGIAQRFRLRGGWAYVAGALSGVFGGMVGNQGGIRTAGLLAFDLHPAAFVATAAAIALIVDGVRLPVYLWESGHQLRDLAPLIVIATTGVVVGTFAGTHVLMRLQPSTFRRLIGAVLLGLGGWLLR
jgi:uncharacterized membrane protein YfcA